MFLPLLTWTASLEHYILPDVARWQLVVEKQQCGWKATTGAFRAIVGETVLLVWVDSLLTYLAEVAAAVPKVLQVLLKSHGTVRHNKRWQIYEDYLVKSSALPLTILPLLSAVTIKLGTVWSLTSCPIVTWVTAITAIVVITFNIGAFPAVLPRSPLNSGVAADQAVALAAVSKAYQVVLVHMSERPCSIHRSKVDGVTTFA
tara:strand:- start:2204 stop:2809 length:606 start_codon:yes stop_codon:yes gene_type:complete